MSDILGNIVKYILDKKGVLTTMKLQKLVFYSHCWYLTCYNKVLFEEEVEAWDNGPVIRSLFNTHKNKKTVSSFHYEKYNSADLLPQVKLILDGVLDFYGEENAEALSLLTHLEEPWLNTKKNDVLSNELILKYFNAHFPQLRLYPITKNISTVYNDLSDEAIQRFITACPTFIHRRLHYIAHNEPSHRALIKEGILTEERIKELKKEVDAFDRYSGA